VKGIYTLLVNLDKEISINIGALGKTVFTGGTYVYVGSAQNNLEKRVQRHLQRTKKLFWHIDYFLNNDASEITRVFYLKDGKTGECRIADELSKRGEAIRGFGCSDCHCTSHLFRLENSEFLRNFMIELRP
jgi:Uri superfamily endonuclease